MVGDNDVRAVISVKDLATAKEFYENTLGLKDGQENPGGIMYTSGNTKILVYQSEFAGSNKSTAATWKVDDPDTVVADLRAKGVTFEHYDLPGTTREGDIHVMGEMRGAWFKDPDGNILCVSNEGM